MDLSDRIVILTLLFGAFLLVGSLASYVEEKGWIDWGKWGL